MKSGTAIGLLVGGAVLILAAKPSAAALAPYGAAQPLPGGALNPLNWFSGALNPQAAAPNIFTQPAANIYSQAASPYQPPALNYSPAATGGLLQPNYNFNPGGSLFADNPALTVAGAPLQIGGGNNNYAAASPSGFQQAAYAVPAAQTSFTSANYAVPVMTPGGGLQMSNSVAYTPAQTLALAAPSPGGYQSNLNTVSL